MLVEGILLRMIDHMVSPGEMNFADQLCLHQLTRAQCSCTRCADACPRGRLSLSGSGPRVDADIGCAACGRCVRECPTGAFQYSKFSTRQLISLLGELGAHVDSLTVGCARRPLRQHDVQVPCYAMIGPLVYLAAADANVRLLLETGYCTQTRCPLGPLMQADLLWLQEGVGEAVRRERRAVVVCTDNPAESVHTDRRVSRRALFPHMAGRVNSYLRQTGVTPQSLMGVRGDDPNEDPDRVLAKRRMLLHLVRRLHETGGLVEGACRHLPLRTVAISDSCDYCRLCTRLCPTGALQGYEQRMWHSAASCIGCGVCKDHCRKSAISHLPPSDIGPVVDGRHVCIREYAVTECIDCGVMFAPDDPAQRHCRVCGQKTRPRLPGVTGGTRA